MPNAKLLVLDNALDHDFYRPVEHWTAAAGFGPDSLHLPGGDQLPAPDAYSHVIISGSEDTITARPDWAEEQARWLAEAARAGTALLGSCWGHQLIAVALVGPQAVRSSPTPEFGWVRIQVSETAGLLPGGGFDAFVSHFDEVIEGAHPDLRTLAHSPACQVQALRWADAPIWGIQAHPEVDPQTGEGFLRGACGLWPEHAAAFQQGLSGPVLDSRAVKALVQRFLAWPRAG